MAYGLWLYKELDTDYGSVRLEISKRDYTGEAQEIEALAADGIVLSMDGEEITDPIIGTQLSINIVDTGQVDTSLFFTPDSTLYAVALYYGSTLEWYGYLTPDSYIESLDYRDTIALTARDNLGRLNDFEFKQTRGMVSAVELIESLLSEVQCSQYINWSVDKVALAKGEGVSQTTSIQDIWVNTDLFVSEEMTYREVVEEILRGLGCQMRFRSGNNLIVVSISDFYLIADQSAIFIERSGVKEIKPAWKELSVTQDYGLIENFYNGHISEQEIGWETFFVPSQKSNKWEGDMIFANQYGWPTGIEDDQDTSIFINAIEPYGTYSAFVIPVKATKTTLKLTMQLNNTLRWLRDNVYRKTSNLYYGGDGANHVISYNITHHIQIIMRNAAGEKYIMSPGDWIRDDNIFAHIDWFQFKLDDCVYDDESTWNKDKECSIQINTIPFDGDLLIAFRTATWDEENRDIPNHMLYAKIKDITLKFDNNIGEKSATVQIKAAHNVTEELELKMGQVPYGKGDYLAYAGGYYSSDGLPLIQWMRKPDDVNFYDLMELVAREHIHLNYDNYPLLSGTMMSSDRTKPLMLGKNIHYKGEIYTIVSGSLNVIKNAMDISIMQKVVPYQIAELAVINSPLESGSGSKVGSGNNEVIQFSGQAGNAKRIYQLHDSVEDEREDAYAIIDSENWDNAKRVKVSELGGLFNKAFEVVTDDAGHITKVISKVNFYSRGGITARYSDGESGGSGGGASNLWELNDVTITNPTDGQSLVYDLASGKWVNRLVGGSSDWSTITNKPTTLAGYGITDALSISGGTITGGLTVSNPDSGQHTISISTNNGTSWIGYNADSDYWFVTNRNWYNSYTIIHSGNIGSYTLFSRTPVTLNQNHNLNDYVSGYYGYINAYKPSNSYGDNTAVLALQSVRGIDTWQIAFNGNGIHSDYGPLIGIRGNFAEQGWSPWYTLATLNSNVASATKLKTARTIWGQSFDGTGNVAAPAIMQYLLFSDSNGGESGYVGRGGGDDTLYLISYKNAPIRIGRNNYNDLIINNGNVGIGTNPYYALSIYKKDTGDLLYLKSNTTYACAIYAPSSSVYWAVGANNNNRFYWYNSAKSGEVALIEENGSFVLQQLSGAANAKTAYISAGNGYSPLSGKYGVKILCCDQADAQTGLGQDCFGAVYELSLITTRNGSNGRIAFGYHYVDSTTYYQLGYFDINGFNVNGNIYATGGITARTSSSSSDAKLKDNITLLSQEDAINILMALKPSSWNWKDGGELAYGLVAQDVESVLPCSVTYGENLSLQYNMFHAFEIGVAQNHETRLQYLERENKELKQELQTLKREYYGIQ